MVQQCLPSPAFFQWLGKHKKISTSAMAVVWSSSSGSKVPSHGTQKVCGYNLLCFCHLSFFHLSRCIEQRCWGPHSTAHHGDARGSSGTWHSAVQFWRPLQQLCNSTSSSMSKPYALPSCKLLHSILHSSLWQSCGLSSKLRANLSSSAASFKELSSYTQCATTR